MSNRRTGRTRGPWSRMVSTTAAAWSILARIVTLRSLLVGGLAALWALLATIVVTAWAPVPDGRHVALIIATIALVVVVDRKDIGA